jgi:Domain of unknown function (DUF6378)
MSTNSAADDPFHFVMGTADPFDPNDWCPVGPTLRALLTGRDGTHGSFATTATMAQGLKAVLHGGRNWPMLTATQREALEAIAVKIARILSGNPEHQDHWADIAGYAKLAVDRS